MGWAAEIGKFLKGKIVSDETRKEWEEGLTTPSPSMARVIESIKKYRRCFLCIGKGYVTRCIHDGCEEIYSPTCIYSGEPHKECQHCKGKGRLELSSEEKE